MLIRGGSLEATWLLLNTLQLIALVPLMSLSFPTNFTGYAKYLAVVNGEPDMLPNVFEDYLFSSKDMLPEAFNDNYSLMGNPLYLNE